VRGTVESFGFDLDNVQFTLALVAPKSSPLEDEPVATEVYLPEWHFPLDDTKIQTSAGSYNVGVEKGMRILRWWHPEGQHNIVIDGWKRAEAPKGVVDRAWEALSSCLETA
jgi:Glycoside hydrolase family 5 C-terminal domain